MNPNNNAGEQALINEAEQARKEENKAELEQLKETAELSDLENAAEHIQGLINELTAMSEKPAISDVQEHLVVEGGGNMEELQEKLEPLQEEKKVAEADAAEQIKAVEKEPESVMSSTENFDTIPKPENVEGIKDYVLELKERALDAIPHEYAESVETFKQFLVEHPESRQNAWMSLSSQKYDPDKAEGKIDELLESMKNMPDTNAGFNVERIFSDMAYKYPELRPAYEKMNTLIDEKAQIVKTARQYNRVRLMSEHPEEINTFFTFPEGYNGSYLDFHNRIDLGKKLIELGALSQEDFNSKMSNLISEIEQRDSYINNPKYSKLREEMIQEMKSIFNE